MQALGANVGFTCWPAANAWLSICVCCPVCCQRGHAHGGHTASARHSTTVVDRSVSQPVQAVLFAVHEARHTGGDLGPALAMAAWSSPQLLCGAASWAVPSLTARLLHSRVYGEQWAV